MIRRSYDAFCRPIASRLATVMPRDRLGQPGLFADYRIFGCGNYSSDGSTSRIRIKVRTATTTYPRGYSVDCINSRLNGVADVFTRAGIRVSLLPHEALYGADATSGKANVAIGFVPALRRRPVMCTRLAMIFIAAVEDRLTWATGAERMIRNFAAQNFKDCDLDPETLPAVDMVTGLYVPNNLVIETGGTTDV